MNSTTDKSLILNFHGIGKCSRPYDIGEESVWVSESAFSSFVDEVSRQPMCKLTFDDGNKSDVEIALPLLRSKSLVGTFFVLTGRIGFPGFLDDKDIHKLLSHGMVIGLHGRNHVSWRSIDEREKKREIDVAKEDLERIAGCRIINAACPFGEYGRRTLRHLRETGFEVIYTSDGGLADNQSWFRPRRSVRTTDRPELVREMLREPFQRRLMRTLKIAVKRLR